MCRKENIYLSTISLKVEKKEREKHGKVGVERKWWSLAQLPYSPQRNGRQNHGGNQRATDHPTWRTTQGAGIVKGWGEKRDCGSIPDIFT